MKFCECARPREKKTFFIGVYYGLQESCNREKIQEEMVYLSEEIAEIKKEGEILLCMDANAKIGPRTGDFCHEQNG